MFWNILGIFHFLVLGGENFWTLREGGGAKIFGRVAKGVGEKFWTVNFFGILRGQ